MSEQLGTKEYFYWLYFILSIMLKCLYFQFTIKEYQNHFFRKEHNDVPCIFFIVIIIAQLLYLFLIKTAVSSFICNFIISILLTSDTNFFRYYYSILTIPVVLQVDLKLLSSVNESIMSLFKLKDIIYILTYLFYLYGLIICIKKEYRK